MLKCLCGNKKGGPFDKGGWWQIVGPLHHCQSCFRLILVLSEKESMCAFFRPEEQTEALVKGRLLHYAIICPFPDIGQVGCTWGKDEADAMSNVEDKRDTVKRMAQKDCRVCNHG